MPAYGCLRRQHQAPSTGAPHTYNPSYRSLRGLNSPVPFIFLCFPPLRLGHISAEPAFPVHHLIRIPREKDDTYFGSPPLASQQQRGDLLEGAHLAFRGDFFPIIFPSRLLCRARRSPHRLDSDLGICGPTAVSTSSFGTFLFRRTALSHHTQHTHRRLASFLGQTHKHLSGPARRSATTASWGSLSNTNSPESSSEICTGVTFLFDLDAKRWISYFVGHEYGFLD